jgi:hypothetical protein
MFIVHWWIGLIIPSCLFLYSWSRSWILLICDYYIVFPIKILVAAWTPLGSPVHQIRGWREIVKKFGTHDHVHRILIKLQASHSRLEGVHHRSTSSWLHNRTGWVVSVHQIRGSQSYHRREAMPSQELKQIILTHGAKGLLDVKLTWRARGSFGFVEPSSILSLGQEKMWNASLLCRSALGVRDELLHAGLQAIIFWNNLS